MGNRYVIYTSLTGKYDNLPFYDVLDQEFDYICFSNDFPDESIQGIWTIKNIPPISKDNVVLSRYSKILPHRILESFDYSLWMDSNLIVKKSKFYEYVKQRIKEDGLWYGIMHPERDCIYEEAIECIKKNKVGFFEIQKQINFYKNEGFPSNYGLFENNIMLRQHNAPAVQSINEKWWDLFKKYSHRDQLSLFYVFWLTKFKPMLLFDEKTHSQNTDMVFHVEHNNTLVKSINKRLRLILFKLFERYITGKLGNT